MLTIVLLIVTFGLIEYYILSHSSFNLFWNYHYPIIIGQILLIIITFYIIGVKRKVSHTVHNGGQEKFHTLFESITDGIFLLNTDGTFADVNKAGYESLGYTKNELLSLHISQIETREFSGKLNQRIEQLLNDGSLRFETSHLHKNGTAIPIEVTARVVEFAGKKFLLGVNRNITERIHTEEKLRYERTVLRTLIDNIPDLIYSKDLEAKKTLANKADVHLMGLQSEEEALGKDDFAFFPPDQAQEFVAEDKRVLETGEPVLNTEGFHFDDKGKWHWYMTSKYPLRDTNGNIIGLAGIGRDITERKLRELDNERRSQRVYHQQSAIVALSTHKAIVQGNISEAVRTITEIVAHTLTVERAGICLCNELGTELHCTDLYELTPTKHSLGQEIYKTDVPHYFQSLKAGHCIDASNARVDQRTNELTKNYLEPLNIISKLDAPILIEGELVGIVTVEQVKELRMWESDEIVFVSEIANQMALALTNEKKQKAERELRRHLKSQTSLVTLLQSDAETVQQFLHNVLEEAIKISESDIGYLYYFQEGKKEFAFNNWPEVTIKKDSVIEPEILLQLEQTGVWQEAVHRRKEVVINDLKTVLKIKNVYPENGLTIKRLLAIPFFQGEHIVAVIGVADKETDYNQSDVNHLQFLMGSIWGKVISIQVETALRESENKFRTMFEHSTDAMLLLDGNVFFDCNKAAMDLMGCTTREQLLSHHPAQLSPEFQPDDVRSMDKAEYLLKEAFEKGALRFEWTHRKMSGEDFPVEVMLTSIPLEGKQVLFTVWRDITERKRSEQMLQEAELILQKSQSVAQIGSYYFDIPSGTWIGSKALDDIFGIDSSYKKDIIGWTALIHPEDRMIIRQYLLNDVLQKYHRFNKEYRIIRQNNGEVRWIHGLGELEFNKNGNPVKMIGTIQDITKRKKTDEQLIKFTEDLKRSNAELQQFAYIASHDLQEPLRMVSSYTQLLDRRYREKLDSDARDFIRFAVDGAMRMQNLIQSLLMYSRLTREKMTFENVDCNAVIKDVIANLQLLIDETRTTITYDALPIVSGHETLLNQLFQNLIGNAIKFRKKDEQPKITITAKQENIDWEFSISDNGIGIDPHYFDRIFLIFQRLHTSKEYPGTGIGLTVCKKIIERHGGKIWLTSSPGSGTTFYFTLPH